MTASAARRGSCRIGGEPGIGKTRLAEELGATAARRRATVAWARCVDAETAPPYWPWAEGVRALLQTITLAELDLPVSCLERLSALVPNLIPRPATSTRSAALTTASDRYQLFDAVRTLLQRASARSRCPGSGRPASGRREFPVTAGIRGSRALRQPAPPRCHVPPCRRNVETPAGNDGGACACRSTEDGADGVGIERDRFNCWHIWSAKAVLTTLSARSTPGPAAIHSS